LGLSLLNHRYRSRARSHMLTECRAEGDYTLWLRFDDGLEGSVYVGELVTNASFSVLGNIDLFKRVSIDPLSNVVTWGSGINLDPEILYRDLASRTEGVLH
jgi:hypothetical protein